MAKMGEFKSMGEGVSYKELLTQISKMTKTLNFMLQNMDSDNVTRLNTDRTSIASADGETIIEGPILKMYDAQATPILRLEMGYDEDTSSFIFALKDELGNDVISLSTGGVVDIGGATSSEIASTVTNFEGRNDRLSTAPASPTILSDGSAIDHTINTGGSSNMSFEWEFTGSGDAYDIDGFKIYMYSSTSASAYTFGATPSAEKQYIVDYTKRALILEGVPTNLYYTFGIQAYRMVDDDISSTGILSSAIIKPSLTAENPYRPSDTVAFDGNVTGTIAGTSATTVKTSAANSVQQDTAYNTVTITPADGLVATRSDDKARTSVRGGELLIEKGDGAGVWEDTVYIDANGDAVFKGKVEIGTDEKVVIEEDIDHGNIQFFDSAGTTVGYIETESINGALKIASDTGAVTLNSLAGAVDSLIAITSQNKINLVGSTSIDLFTADLKINAAIGWSGTFTNGDGNTVTVTKGIITNVV